VLSGAFALVLALYDTFEYACCYNDEKRKTMWEWLRRRMENEAGGNTTRATVGEDTVQTSDSLSEMTRLLDGEERLFSTEEIAMDTFSACSDAVPTAERVTRFTDDDDDVIIELERELQRQLS